jgi:DNA-binding beta-propeller fold protein YncE
MLSRRIATALSLAAGAIVALGAGASPALAETHPFLGPLGGSLSPDTFTNPNGIAVEESTGDVYVADIATNTVSKFDASGNPVDFTCGAECATYVKGNEITGSPAGSFSFPNAPGTPAAIAVDNSTSPSDPNAGDLYVLDLGHGVIDRFNAKGEYAGQIPGPLTGFALDANGEVQVENIAENGVAVGPNAEVYLLLGCGCVQKFGGRLNGKVSGLNGEAYLGLVDSGLGDVAVAVDPVSGHLYIDDQSSVAEWDTGAMNGRNYRPFTFEVLPTGALLPPSFTSLGLLGVPAQQGGIAVNGTNGKIYVSNPADGNVYVFASTAPAVAAGAATNVSKTPARLQGSATLQGSVDPRGVRVTSCEFEYEKVVETMTGFVTEPVTVFEHSVGCAQTAQIGSGTSPVGVSADIGGLEPGALYDFRLTAVNANGASSSEGRLVVGDTFGIKEFGVEFLNRDGTQDTQAGSHPYEMITSFTFNMQMEHEVAFNDSPYNAKPAGNVRDIIVDTPPGLVGDPNATETKCTLRELEQEQQGGTAACPPGSAVGELQTESSVGYGNRHVTWYNMVPPHGVAAQFGATVIVPKAYIDAGLQTGGQYPLAAVSMGIPAIEPLTGLKVTMFGVTGSAEHRKPFLTLPTGCNGPLRSTISVDSYQEPDHYVGKSYFTHDANGNPITMTGCSKLLFPTKITVVPDVTGASTPSGLAVGVHVPQTAAFNPEGLAESALRDTTVALPEGVAINPAGADGLEACSEGLAGFTGLTEFNPGSEPGVKTATFTPTPVESLQPGVSFCPDSSKIGTVKIKTPLLLNALEGSVYLAAQNENPFGSLIAMYLIVEDPVSGSTVKLAGEVLLCESVGQLLNGVTCQAPGQVVTTFKNTPDLPFEDLELHFYGGERAPLRTPSRCGTYTTQALFTPWDGNAPVQTSSHFDITSGPNGGPCPGASLPFNPSLTAGTTSNQAGGFSPFTMTMSRTDGNQNLQAISLHMPPGLSGLLTGVELCPEPQADEGTCGPNSLIGETTVSVGVGGKPFSVKGGKVFMTGPYEGAAFGLSIVNPAKAGPYDLEKGTPCDCVLVRAKVEVDPVTAALVITTDNSGPYKIPTILKGIPLEIQHVNVTINRHGFTFNPTDCNKLQITGTLYSTERASSAVSIPLQATNCAVLGFKPQLRASTSGHTSRAKGASLSVKLTYPSAPQDTQANIKSVKVSLPKQLPSRLTTLQKACPAATFEANPASCPAASRIGYARATTPLIPVPMTGPAFFVSHGGEAFPSLIVVLQGYSVTVDLVGTTFISKAGITSSTFKTVPDVPVGTFELKLPEGKYSALAANGNLCTSSLKMPTSFVAQNGAVIKQSTPITATGCPKKHKAKAKSKTKKKK